jgi:hypothetical protein
LENLKEGDDWEKHDVGGWMIIIIWIMMECCGHWIGLTQGREKWKAVMNAVMELRVL